MRAPRTALHPPATAVADLTGPRSAMRQPCRFMAFERMINLFESCYFDQIQRFYQQRDEDAMNQHDDHLSCD